MLGFKLNHVSKSGPWSKCVVTEVAHIKLTWQEIRSWQALPDAYIDRNSPVGNVTVWQKAPPLEWHHNNGRDGVSNHQPHHCLLNRLFMRRSKKTSKLCVTGLCAGNSLVTGEFPRKGPVTRKIFPFDDVIMSSSDLAKSLGCEIVV